MCTKERENNREYKASDVILAIVIFFGLLYYRILYDFFYDRAYKSKIGVKTSNISMLNVKIYLFLWVGKY